MKRDTMLISILVKICKLKTTPGLFKYLSKEGSLQKINGVTIIPFDLFWGGQVCGLYYWPFFGGGDVCDVLKGPLWAVELTN